MTNKLPEITQRDISFDNLLLKFNHQEVYNKMENKDKFLVEEAIGKLRKALNKEQFGKIWTIEI